jgi:hypothetical protein
VPGTHQEGRMSRRLVVKLRPAHGHESCGVIFCRTEAAREYIKGLSAHAKAGMLGAAIYEMVDPVVSISNFTLYTVTGKTVQEVEFIHFTSPSIARPA